MEELVVTLLGDKTFEFKALFSVIYSVMKEKKIGGGEEMLRLRTYEKLQSLVREGGATKVDGRYKGVKKRLLVIAEQLKDRRLPKHHIAGVHPSQNVPNASETPPSASPRPRSQRLGKKKIQKSQ